MTRAVAAYEVPCIGRCGSPVSIAPAGASSLYCPGCISRFRPDLAGIPVVGADPEPPAQRAAIPPAGPPWGTEVPLWELMAGPLRREAVELYEERAAVYEDGGDDRATACHRAYEALRAWWRVQEGR